MMARTFQVFWLLLFLLMIPFVKGNEGGHKDKAYTAAEAFEKDDAKEFLEFCERQEELRQDPESIKRDCKRIHEKDFHLDDLRMIFALFVIILWGALVKTMLRVWKIPLPYTVVLMFSGIAVGWAAKYNCLDLYTYTAIARVKPQFILFSLLPVLIFETAFNIPSHVFFKAAWQIIILALPGMLFATFLTAMLCYQFFSEYKWSFLQSCFYGSIISATDPVAVVAILKEVGASESLSVIVDGESLLNDGVAILLFEIFDDMIKGEISSEPGDLAAKVSIMFFRIAIGGPIFGFLSAKLVILCLSRIFNDAIVEIALTLVGAYLTYYIADAVLGMSGVCAVVLFGITMSSERTCISPETLKEVHEFWEMAAHLANTVLFVITGIVISERGSRSLTAVDVYYLILFYIALNVIRFLMLLVFSPLLNRTGYGMNWKNLLVMMWGGLRGGIGICLSLQVYEDIFFCQDTTFGPKILFHTAGIVMLTLVINGTTTKRLLETLGLTEITPGQMEEMQIAVKHLQDAHVRALAMLKHDRYLSEADWKYIGNYTIVSDPYKDALVQKRKPLPKTSLLSLREDDRYHPCPHCHELVENEPSNDEYRSMTDEARLRVLKALKISFWRQFEEGVLTEVSLKTLVGVIDGFTDKEMAIIHASDISKYFELRGCVPKLRAKMIASFGATGNSFRENLPPQPESKFRAVFWWIVSRHAWDVFMTLVVLANLVPLFMEFSMDVNATHKQDASYCSMEERHVFTIINIVFTTIYLVEFIFKLIGLGYSAYFMDKWNDLDFLILMISIVDWLVETFSCGKEQVPGKKGNMGFGKILKGLRLLRILRSVRLVKMIIPAFIKLLNSKVHHLMFIGYDIAVGYSFALEDVLRYIKQMVENETVMKKLRLHLTRERTEIMRHIGLMQRDHPGIAIAVKTRYASRIVLNDMRRRLMDLRMDGLLDEKENQLLTLEIEERMKRLWSSPNYIAPSSPEVLIQNLPWVYGNRDLKDFIFTQAEVKDFALGDVMADVDDEPNGIYVIVAGMVKITFEPSYETTTERIAYGVIPNTELFRDMEFDKDIEDYFTNGTVIGESGLLTKRSRSGKVICESEVKTYYLSMALMEEALQKFSESSDSLESRMWRSIGMKRGAVYLPTADYYLTWSPDKIKIHLARSIVPIGPQFDVIDIPEYVLDIFVIEGYVQDAATGETYIAPSLVGRNCVRLICNVPNPLTVNRVLLITQDTLPAGTPDDDLSRWVQASMSYRKGTPAVVTEDLDDEMNRGWLAALHLNFVTRQKKRRKSAYVADDEKILKDETTRRRTDRAVQRNMPNYLLPPPDPTRPQTEDAGN